MKSVNISYRAGGVFGLILLCTSPGHSQAADNCSDVKIDSIVANQAITGHVSTQISPGNQVVVYVHTNRWYIHPYAGQGDGLSWASIKPNGSWKLKTVKREFDANQVGAFVIPAGAPIPDALTAPDVDLSPTASCVRVLLNPDGKNDPDYGKL